VASVKINLKAKTKKKQKEDAVTSSLNFFLAVNNEIIFLMQKNGLVNHLSP
jgi:hypothetical protein